MDEIIENLKKHGAKKIAIFGSYARGEVKPGSDLDVIVEFLKKERVCLSLWE